MAFDGIVTRAMVRELQDRILLGKIEKVYQPEADDKEWQCEAFSFSRLGTRESLLYHGKSGQSAGTARILYAPSQAPARRTHYGNYPKGLGAHHRNFT